MKENQSNPSPKKLQLIKGKCPLCQKQSDLKYRPFCSDRCRKIDLNRWLEGVYKVPTEETDGEEES